MKNYVIALVIVVAVAFVMAGPFVSIIAINRLFGTNIEFTFLNWLSVMWFHGLIAARAGK